MPQFITKSFLRNISKSGRLLDAIEMLEKMDDVQRSNLKRLEHLDNWECVLEEILDTDHETSYYVPFVNELAQRGMSNHEIKQMRMIAWETAGWFNFEMMAWDWCHLEMKDMYLGLDNRLESKNIDKSKYDLLDAKIKMFNERRPTSRCRKADLISDRLGSGSRL